MFLFERSKDVKLRFWSKALIGDANQCWDWQGAKQPKGYGTFLFDGNVQLAHRVAYQLLLGPIPDETLDHACKNKSCVNPSHLVPMSHSLNSGQDKILSQCKRGHLLTPDNRVKGLGRCLACARLKNKEYYHAD